MDRQPSTDDLLRAVAREDLAAFRMLYDRSSQKLFGIALRICRERALAEDAMQEAYAEIWRKSAMFDPNRGRAEAWMAVIARNRAIDLFRRRVQDAGRATAGVEDLSETFATAPQVAGTSPEYLALVECLRRLEDKQRKAVLLAYQEGFSREELASHFGAPPNTVKTWLRRALAKLRTCLDE